MAKAAAAGKKGGKKGKKKGGNRFGTTAVFVFLLVGLMMLKPAVALVGAIGLAPSMVAIMVESGPFRAQRVRTIFAFNMAGVVPYLVQYWFNNDLEALLQDFTELWLFAVMYGAAAGGMVVLWAAPLLVASMVQASNAEKVKKINKAEQALIDEWGADVNQPDA